MNTLMPVCAIMRQILRRQQATKLGNDNDASAEGCQIGGVTDQQCDPTGEWLGAREVSSASNHDE